MDVGRLIFPVIGLLFAFLGNVMHSIKPNYFVGIRTPWTLENDETWRATHRLAGKLWFTGGIIIAVAMLVMHPPANVFAFFSITAILVLVPVIYSYRYFKAHQLNKG